MARRNLSYREAGQAVDRNSSYKSHYATRGAQFVMDNYQFPNMPIRPRNVTSYVATLSSTPEQVAGDMGVDSSGSSIEGTLDDIISKGVEQMVSKIVSLLVTVASSAPGELDLPSLVTTITGEIRKLLRDVRRFNSHNRRTARIKASSGVQGLIGLPELGGVALLIRSDIQSVEITSGNFQYPWEFCITGGHEALWDVHVLLSIPESGIKRVTHPIEQKLNAVKYMKARWSRYRLIFADGARRGGEPALVGAAFYDSSINYGVKGTLKFIFTIIRLRLGHAYTKDQLYLMRKVPSSHCVVCHVPETLEHIFMTCPVHQLARIERDESKVKGKQRRVNSLRGEGKVSFDGTPLGNSERSRSLGRAHSTLLCVSEVEEKARVEASMMLVLNVLSKQDGQRIQEHLNTILLVITIIPIKIGSIHYIETTLVMFEIRILKKRAVLTNTF
uniref:Uncharacterized protein n=1 Tax=Timema monikensis TaxID=170555 RepID=A0A7R9HU95_9NEOP|nr:unnamed protein product [Timema monikensis]